jgi:hypothetical protein
MPKKAVLGFRYISLDEEMLVPTEQELTHAVEGVERSSHEREKKRKLRWWHDNKRKINSRRRAVACSIEKRYKAAKSRADRRGWGWEFSQEEWERAWEEAGWVEVPGSRSPSNPNGIVVPAFALRGSHALNNTCMQRLDPNKPWSIDNYKIMFRGEELKPGNRWFREAPDKTG